MEKNNEQYKPRRTPTIVVGEKDFNALAYTKVASYTLHGKRMGRKVVGKKAQPLSENEAIFLGSPKTIIFRKRWSFSKVMRRVRYIQGDRSDRFDIRFTIYFK